ncbi:hypothetical protein BXO88_07950 [Oribacterium sp. C9]|uniref:acyltransferase family protein n=1 Tax=Oribacterium sp. C9 TaxID=1943579 RepID=UPI00098F575B|nr:acyltransferase [Oribacterium sp. C9]OON86437.1 hypothetical protein BXO88_07950 [Oribacterium sp. C9]
MAEEIKKAKKKGRDAGLDLIRVVACLLVVGTHVDVMGTGDSTKLFIRLLFADGVTLFFILSGFFFFRKGFVETLKRALSSIVFPGIAVMLLSYQFSPFVRDEENIIYCFTHLNFDVCGFLTDLFSWGGNIRESMAAHLWYIFTYLQLVLAYPLLKPLYSENVRGIDINEKDRFRKYRWFIIGFIFINQILMDLNMTGLISFSPVQISPFMLYTAPAMLLLTGAEIKDLKRYLDRPEAVQKRKQVRIISAAVLVIAFASRFFLQRQVFILNSSQDFYLYWNCAFATVQSTAFVIFILSFDYEKNKPVNFIARAGRYTFWIYLLHYGIYYFIFFRKGQDWSFGIIDMTNGYDTIWKEILHILIRVPTVFLLSLLASYVIENIKRMIQKLP